MIEIERKFLVVPGEWPRGARQLSIRQGYIVKTDGVVLRVRQKQERYFISVKAKIDSLSSYDFEYEIPPEDACLMFEHMCIGTVSKTRHEVFINGLLWEIDEFHDANLGLVVAEIELPCKDHKIDRPPWLGREVTGDERYRNVYLSQHPFGKW